MQSNDARQTEQRHLQSALELSECRLLHVCIKSKRQIRNVWRKVNHRAGQQETDRPLQSERKKYKLKHKN